uniref:Uncharacterized protein n=1 Tax=Triticum urartu TaxID=4572 RepID=A0A8R7V4I5_TRIUA
PDNLHCAHAVHVVAHCHDGLLQHIKFSVTLTHTMHQHMGTSLCTQTNT